MSLKSSLSNMVPSALWAYLRSRKILRHHRQVSEVCQGIIDSYYNDPDREDLVVKPLKTFDKNKIIWQYWGQGFNDLPSVIKECIASVDKWKGDYTIIRLTDETVGKYIQWPSFILEKKQYMSRAYYSDLLRVALLSTYGGVWLDATIFLSGYLPERYSEMDYFLYQRDPSEQNKKYWENTYAYYFGWGKNYAVNMLSSVIFAKPGSKIVTDLCQVMLHYWKSATSIPDYFFLQVLYDVMIKRYHNADKCTVESDCLPHYLQQLRNDPKFSLATEEEILKMTPIHKLTYK